MFFRPYIFRSYIFSSVHFFVRIFFRLCIFSSTQIFVHAEFRLCHFSSTQIFVCAIFRPRRFSSTQIFVCTIFRPRRFSSVLFFVHAVCVFAVFRLCIFRLCHFSSMHSFLRTFVFVHAVLLCPWTYTCRGLRPIVREVSAIRGRSCVAAERRSDSAPDDDVVVGRPPSTGTEEAVRTPFGFPGRSSRAGRRQAPTPPTSWRRGPSRRLLHPGAIPASHQAETYRAMSAVQRHRLPCGPRYPHGLRRGGGHPCPRAAGVSQPVRTAPPYAGKHRGNGERPQQWRRGGGLHRRLHGLQEPLFSGYLTAPAVMEGSNNNNNNIPPATVWLWPVSSVATGDWPGRLDMGAGSERRSPAMHNRP